MTTAPPSPRWWYSAASLLLLVPCFWQPRIQAGDLSSHIYNAWLARLIETGHAAGLVIARQNTNVLFDWILAALYRPFGASAAQRIAVSLAVLVFVWGAFALISAISGERPWRLLPVLAILAYGWVFHSGFFNFYLSLGLCFWALALAWEYSPRRVAAALLLFAAAWLGHNLPVLWSLSILAYRYLSPRFAARWLLAAYLAALALTHVAVRAIMLAQWYPRQITLATGADQAHLFDDKYYIPFLGLALTFLLMLIDLVSRSGLRRIVSGLPFQVWLLTLALVALLPTAIIGGGVQAAYISDRMSLPAGVCLCAVVAPLRPRTLERYAILCVTLVFFGFLFRDERLLNAFEDRLERAVAQVPAGQRVISAVDDPDLHVNALTHMIDRVCTGRCFSYANYEASTAQFRIRAARVNPFVAATYLDSWRLQNGTYVVRPEDLPLYQVTIDDTRSMLVRQLYAGQMCGSEYWRALPDLF